MHDYPYRTRRKKPKPILTPRDEATLRQLRKEAEEKKQFFEKNFLAASKQKTEIAGHVARLRNNISNLRHEDQRHSVFRSVFGTVSKTVQEKIDSILSELRALEGKRFRFDGREFDIGSLVRHCDAEAGRWAGRLADIEKELRARAALDAREAREKEAAERQLNKEAKQKQQAALAAARLEKQRDLADGIKRKLTRAHPCPYCAKELGVNPHADHIYPVSRGGLSVSWNMVFVCQDCNQKKGDLTLIDFIVAHSLDAATIINTLRGLGKRI